MLINNNNAADIIQEIIDKQKRPFMTVKNLVLAMSTQVKRGLGLENTMTSGEIKRVIESLAGDRFIFHKKGARMYILIPCDPVDLVKAELSPDKPKGASGIASVLPFSKADVSKILNHLLDTGEAKLILNVNLDTRIIATGRKADWVSSSNNESESETQPVIKPVNDSRFTQNNFINAIRELDRGNYFVKISELREKLNWPREVFDAMLIILRDREVIQMHIADDTILTPDEVNNCFVDENNYRMGTVTLNVR